MISQLRVTVLSGEQVVIEACENATAKNVLDEPRAKQPVEPWFSYRLVCGILVLEEKDKIGERTDFSVVVHRHLKFDLGLERQ